MRAVVIGDRDWPQPDHFPPVERVPAVHETHPTGGNNALWSCYQAHLGVWRRAIELHTDPLIVFEDDAILVPDFATRLHELLAVDGWAMMYLGGQITGPTHSWVPGVLELTSASRTHAYALRLAGAERLVYQARVPKGAFDDTLVHWLDPLIALAPTDWLAGQGAGHSAITGRDEPERWWHH